jgi:hypothetical protein
MERWSTRRFESRAIATALIELAEKAVALEIPPARSR